MQSDKRFSMVLNGTKVSYILRRSRRARYARMEINPEHGLIVVIPAFRSLGYVQEFLEQKRTWIAKNLVKYGPLATPPHNLQQGDSLPYLGALMKIEVRQSGGEVESVKTDRDRLVVNVSSGDDRLRLVLEGWCRHQARLKIAEMLKKYASQMGLAYNKVFLKGQRTIWGSCSRKNNLNFNWRLIMTPEPVISYVIIHELAHLKEMSHSRKFWQIVEKYCPDWRIHREWLKNHANELNRTLRAQSPVQPGLF
jgi:predicted metal-dependent hydrolase